MFGFITNWRLRRAAQRIPVELGPYLIRQYGATYAELETRGIRLAVTDASAKYHEPARYDNELIVETILCEITAVRMRFEYRILRADDEALLVTASTMLASLDENGRPQRIPKDLVEALREHDA